MLALYGNLDYTMAFIVYHFTPSLLMQLMQWLLERAYRLEDILN
jgi:hypothetical protein